MSTSYLRKQNMIEQALIDDCFYIKKQRWGTFVSMHKSGRELLTSLSEEQCVEATRWYLKAEQDGFPDSSKSYDSVVGGKL
jgi:hypothetical protein